jgi:hypothetical protein
MLYIDSDLASVYLKPTSMTPKRHRCGDVRELCTHLSNSLKVLCVCCWHMVAPRMLSSLAVEVAKIAIPSHRNDIYNQDTMFKRHELEIDCLYPWPYHPVLL